MYDRNEYKSDNLYTQRQVLGYLKDCKINPALITDFEVTMAQTSNEIKKDIVDPFMVALRNQPTKFGEAIKETWIDLIREDLLTPQYEAKVFEGYSRYVNEQLDRLKPLIEHKDYQGIADNLSKIVSETIRQDNMNSVLKLIGHFSFELGPKRSLAPGPGFNWIEEPGLVPDWSTLSKYKGKINNNNGRAFEWLSKQYYEHHDQYFAKTMPATDPKLIILKKGAFVYKGVQKDKQGRLTNMHDYYWVAPNLKASMGYSLPIISGPHPSNPSYWVVRGANTVKELCENYGYIGVFEVIEDVPLANFDNPAMIKALDLIVRGVFTTKDGKVYRVGTQQWIDEDMAKKLCEKGYNGYAIGPVGFVSDPKTIFQSEIMLCKPKEHLRLIDQLTVKDLGLHYCQPPFETLESRLA